MIPPARPQPPPAILHPSLQAPMPSNGTAGLPPQFPPAASPHSADYASALRSPPPPISSPMSGFPQPAYPAMRAAPPGMRAVPPKPISAPPGHTGSSPLSLPPPPPPGISLAIPPGVSPSPSPSPASAPFRAPPPPFNPYQLQYPPPLTPHFSPPLVHANSVPTSAAASAYPSSSPSPASATSQPQQFSPSLGSFNASRRSPSISTGGPSPMVSPLISPQLPPPLQTFLPSPTHPAAQPTPALAPSLAPASAPMPRSVSLPPASSPPAASPNPATPAVPHQQYGAAPASASPPSSGGASRPRASHLPHIQALHLADSTRDYPIMSPSTTQHNRTPSQTSQSSGSRHVSPAVAPITFTLTPSEQPLDASHSHYEEPALVDALDHHTIDERAGGDGGRGGDQNDGHDSDHSEHEEEIDDDPPGVHFDPSDMLGRLCSSEKIKADDLNFWRSVMDGMEWAFFDAQAPEVQKLIAQYCKSFVATAARSRNLHAMLLVICRHLENYSQHLHMVSAASSSSSAASAASSSKSSANAGGSLLTKDHKWVTSLLFFLRVVVQYVLTHMNYEDTLRFFAHLAVPDAASKPNTPKTAIPSYSNQGSWSNSVGGGSSLSVPASAYRSRSPSPQSPRGGTISGLASPPSHVAINLNPNSRRSSLNSQTDVLTRFVCAIVNSLEVLGDAKLNQEIASAKSGSSAEKAAAKETKQQPLSSPSHAAMAAAAAASASTSSPPPSSKGSQPVTDLHLELLNTFFVLLSTQMYLPLSTEYEQVFLDRLLYCCKPPMLNSMQGFVTALISAFTEILPADYATTVFQRASQNASNASSQSVAGGFFSKLTSKLSTLFYFPVWAVRYLFTIPPNHPLIDRSTLLLELLVYQNNDNVFRESVRKLRDADPPSNVSISRSASGHSNIIAAGVTPLMPSQAAGGGAASPTSGANITGPEDLSSLSMLDKFEAGAISYSKLYYSLCSTLLSEHINLFLYSLIHENVAFRRYILSHHTHDLDYLLMPQLEILYREVDISKHHVYMIINIWILLTQNHGFDAIIKRIRIKDVPFFKEMVLKDLQLTQVMQIVLLRTLQLNLRTKLKEPHIFNNCLPEEDHQVLTEQGFMFLPQVEEALRGQKQLRIACYDESSKQLQYHPITAADLVVKHGLHRMVDISDAKSTATQHVALSVTADHDLYLRYGEQTGWQTGGFNKVQAGELLTTEFARFKMLAAATGGVEQQPLSSPPFVAALGLTSSCQVDAFLELYGYWLGAGSLSLVDSAIVFSPTNESDEMHLDQWLVALPLQPLLSAEAGALGYWRQSHRADGRRIYMICHPAWWSFFSNEHARAIPPAASSQCSKRFAEWVRRDGMLQPNQLRAIIRGLTLAGGEQADDDTSSEDGEDCCRSSASGTLFTSCALFRDQLMIVLLHAGYSTYFTQTVSNIQCVANSAQWTIRYSAQPRATEPILHVDRGVRERQLHGRVWCVTVPHKDHLIAVRRAQTDASGTIVEASRPLIIGNCLAAFCNLTITALIGPTLGTTPGNTPLVSPTSPSATSPPGSATTPGSAGLGGSVLSVPLTLHPQVSFRLVRVLCILSRKFLSLQVLHESQIIAHNARVELMASENREEVTEDEEREEVDLEETAEELGTCMEFIQLLLEVVNHAIVHSMPTPHPLAPPSQVAAFAAQSASADGPALSSLASNPHLLYHLLHAKDYFLQLLPYAHLFENNLISNLTNTIAFYEQAPGVVMPLSSDGMARSVAAAAKVPEKALEKVVSALRTAIGRTPMNNAGALYPSPGGGHSPSGSADSGAGASPQRKFSHALPPGSCPSFDPTALIERGPFTYHEQENSQDFFIPYIYQLAQTMKILPRMYAAGADDAASPHSANGEGHSSPQGAAMQAAAAALGDVDADVEFIRELEAEEAAAAAAAAGHNGEMQAHDQEEDDAERYDDEEEQEEDGFGGMLPAPVVEAEDNSKVRVAIM